MATPNKEKPKEEEEEEEEMNLGKKYLSHSTQSVF